MINGCLEYETAVVEINFPKGEARCKLCPLLQTYSRNQCMRTGELIPDTQGRGIWCPLRFLREVTDDELKEEE
jgi:hypothetical protein